MTRKPTWKPNRSYFVLALALVALSCSSRLPYPSVDMGWQPVTYLNENLPSGIRVYEGVNSELPLKAWYVQVRKDPRITARVVVSEDDDKRESVSDFARRLDAVVVVNGGYFIMGAEPARHVGLLYIDGSTIEPSTPSVIKDETRYYTTRSALGFTSEGRIDVAWIGSRNDSLFEWIQPPANVEGIPAPRADFGDASYWDVRDAIAGGPSLISRGIIDITVDEEVFFGSSIPRTHPRTAAGYTRSGDLILLIVDGRQAGSRGVDLVELASLMYDLGCIEALNLDGGGSSTLVVNGVLVNRPAGETYQREVMSALAVLADPDP